MRSFSQASAGVLEESTFGVALLPVRPELDNEALLVEELISEAISLADADSYVPFTGYQFSLEVSDLLEEGLDTLLIRFELFLRSSSCLPLVHASTVAELASTL